MKPQHLALVLGPALLAACEQDVFTPDERAALEDMRLAPLPPDSSNAFADDLAAFRTPGLRNVARTGP
jgi:hypothetical protein